MAKARALVQGAAAAAVAAAGAAAGFWVGRGQPEVVEQHPTTLEDINRENATVRLAPEFASCGLPSPSGGTVVQRHGYAFAYDTRAGVPRWVAHVVRPRNRDLAAGGGGRSKASFRADPSVPAAFRVRPGDLAGSGLDRGHMAPAADFAGDEEAMKNSFLLGNCAPQDPGLNRGAWARLEAFARRLASGPCDRVVSVTAPLYEPRRKGKRWELRARAVGKTDPPRVLVPTHFAKALLCEREGRPPAVAGVVMPNRNLPASAELAPYLRPLEDIERAMGATIFPGLAGREVLPLCSEVSCRLPPPRRYGRSAKRQGGDKAVGEGAGNAC